jgi:hypothetical protein
MFSIRLATKEEWQEMKKEKLFVYRNNNEEIYIKFFFIRIRLSK